MHHRRVISLRKQCLARIRECDGSVCAPTRVGPPRNPHTAILSSHPVCGWAFYSSGGSQPKKGEKIMKPASIRESIRSIFHLLGSSAEPHLRRSQVAAAALAMAFCCSYSASARAQQITVDCTGTDPYANFQSINAALSSGIGPWATISIAGPCTENVYISNVNNLRIGAYWGETVDLNGGIWISGSNAVYLYGLNVSNANGDGFNVNSSRAITLDTCTSNRNQANGLNVSNLSEVTVVAPASFDSNGVRGISMGNHSSVGFANWSAPLAMDVSNNLGSGVFMTQGSVLAGYGVLTFQNNNSLSGANSPGFGIEIWGESIAQLGTCTGSNFIQGNQAGGVLLNENSQLSIFDCGNSSLFQNSILGNGPVGISAGFGSQVTLYGKNVQITNHTGPALDVYANSQLYATGAAMSQNGASGDPRTAAIRLDGNSEAFLRNIQISMNRGPAILALVNSSADFTGASLSGNSGGMIVCDSSSWMVSDISMANNSSFVPCRTPHNLGNRRLQPFSFAKPDFTLQKSMQAAYKKSATRIRH